MFLFISFFSAIIFISLIVFFLFIKNKYKEYDEQETIKEMIDSYKNLIKGAMDYFNNKYNNDFDHTVYENLRIRVGFIKGLIIKQPTKKQLYYYKKLYEMLYETESRLIKDFYNVKAIIAPIDNLRNEIVQEHIDYIKENSEIY